MKKKEKGLPQNILDSLCFSACYLLLHWTRL